MVRDKGQIDAPRVLWADRQVIVIWKPPGMPSQPDKTGDPCAIEWTRSHLLDSGLASVGSNPFVAPVHRLDRPVSGVLVLARSSKAAARLSEQFRGCLVRKGYLAVVEGSVRLNSHRVTVWLRKDRRTNLVRARSDPGDGFLQAETDIQLLYVSGDHTLVSLFPLTGRPHQLRATLAFLGFPISGDLRYGASAGHGRLICLHSHFVAFRHPISDEPLVVIAPVPRTWQEIFPWLFDYLPPFLRPFTPLPRTVTG